MLIVLWMAGCADERAGVQIGDDGQSSECEELAVVPAPDPDAVLGEMGQSPAEAVSAFLGDWSGTLALDGDDQRVATLTLTSMGDVTWVERRLPEVEDGVDLPAVASPEFECADYYRFEALLALSSDDVLDESWSDVEVRVYPEGQGARLEVDVPFDDIQGTLEEPAPPTGSGRFGLSMRGSEGRWDGTVLWSDGASTPPTEEPGTASVPAPIGTLEVTR